MSLKRLASDTTRTSTRLTLEVWTNGSMTPQDAVALSSRILIGHFEEFLKLQEFNS
jgi:DNA-directed RNA polymerase alpha subunit